MSNDTVGKTIVVALGVCFVWSLLVSTAAITLQPRQERNKRLEKIKNILMVGNLYKDGKNVEKIFKEKITPAIIDLTTGNPLPDDQQKGVLEPANYEIKEVAKHPEYSEAIPGNEDIAGIKRKPRYALVYYIRENNEVSKVIIPVFGKGLWSTLYGFLALDKDLKTIRGITFYEHGETPGLGGEIDNPRWKSLWDGKLAFDENWDLKIEVIKGEVDTTRPEAKYKVDGLSGSTLTTRGVDNLVRFWLGDKGYGHFLKKLREELIHG
jgi:Na+-transporting NADH:ubiquinone oxidoreductase subunit C